MSALTLADIAATDTLTDADVGDRVGGVLAVHFALRDSADAANLANCERSLRQAARIVMDLWSKTQAERSRRGTIELDHKRPALA